MKNFLISALALFALANLYACKNTGTGNKQNGTQEDSTKKAIALTPVTNSPTYPDATLTIDQMTTKKQGDSALLQVKFGVKNYALTSQTSDAPHKHSSNSAKGQHIHFILDDEPYVALYEPQHEVTLPLNSEHYLLCFLSRSYHESLKNPSAAVLKHFKIDGEGNIQQLDIPSSPMLFYSRPKGDYSGEDTKNILLDFYVYGGKLGNSLQVKATIDDSTFILKDWQPYFIENAPMGDLNVKLQLQHADGSPVEGPNTSADRVAHLSADSTME